MEVVGCGENYLKITKLENGIFYSILDIDCDDIGHREIDSRPSDALAIAIRMHSPILVANEVMEEGILLEDELDEEFELDEKGLHAEADAENDVVFGEGQIDSNSIWLKSKLNFS